MAEAGLIWHYHLSFSPKEKINHTQPFLALLRSNSKKQSSYSDARETSSSSLMVCAPLHSAVHPAAGLRSSPVSNSWNLEWSDIGPFIEDWAPMQNSNKELLSLLLTLTMFSVETDFHFHKGYLSRGHKHWGRTLNIGVFDVSTFNWDVRIVQGLVNEQSPKVWRYSSNNHLSLILRLSYFPFTGSK